MNLPDFLCIGAQKAGTSWLNAVLDEHPSIFMPPVNELHFFDRVNRKLPLRKRQIALTRKAVKRENSKGESADPAYLDYLARLISFPEITEEWYRAAYSPPVGADIKKGDITPSYLELSEGDVAYARTLLGPAKIILIIRRPVDRLLSQLRMWVTRRDRNWHPTGEAEWMGLLNVVTEKESRGAYSRGVPLWRKHFGAENLLVLPYSDMKTDPRGMISRIEDHIGVPHFDDFTILETPIHVTKKYEIPETVTRRAGEICAEEDAFLRSEFGQEFFDKTR